MRRREVEGDGEYVDKVGKEQVECSEVKQQQRQRTLLKHFTLFMITTEEVGTDLDEALMDSNEKKERQKGNQENT